MSHTIVIYERVERPWGPTDQVKLKVVVSELATVVALEAAIMKALYEARKASQ